jgi:hypothetical protein
MLVSPVLSCLHSAPLHQVWFGARLCSCSAICIINKNKRRFYCAIQGLRLIYLKLRELYDMTIPLHVSKLEPAECKRRPSN